MTGLILCAVLVAVLLTITITCAMRVARHDRVGQR